MTHPPQPPDPYGEQGGYGQGPYPHAQFQPGASSQPGSFGGPPAPPKQRRTGLWAGLSAGVVVIVAFVITAFVAPGFLLSSKGPQEIARATAAAIDAHDKAALYRLACSDASSTVRAAIGAVGDVRSARLESIREPAQDRAVAEIAVRAGGTRGTVNATFTRQDGAWCWQDVRLTR